jgi:hypothetical protein
MPELIENSDSYSTAEKHCACIEFHLPEQPGSGLPRRHGFNISQMIEYTLEPNLDAEDDKNEPPQKRTVAFSTADVVILGWSLGRLADLLREINLAVVYVRPERFANLKRFVPFVSSIAITPLQSCEPLYQ